MVPLRTPLNLNYRTVIWNCTSSDILSTFFVLNHSTTGAEKVASAILRHQYLRSINQQLIMAIRDTTTERELIFEQLFIESCAVFVYENILALEKYHAGEVKKEKMVSVLLHKLKALEKRIFKYKAQLNFAITSLLSTCKIQNKKNK